MPNCRLSAAAAAAVVVVAGLCLAEPAEFGLWNWKLALRVGAALMVTDTASAAATSASVASVVAAAASGAVAASAVATAASAVASAAAFAFAAETGSQTVAAAAHSYTISWPEETDRIQRNDTRASRMRNILLKTCTSIAQ